MFWKDLSKKEKRHLRDVAGVRTLTKFKDLAKAHAQMRRENEARWPDTHTELEPCWECRAIAKKLGLEV